MGLNRHSEGIHDMIGRTTATAIALACLMGTGGCGLGSGGDGPAARARGPVRTVGVEAFASEPGRATPTLDVATGDRAAVAGGPVDPAAVWVEVARVDPAAPFGAEPVIVRGVVPERSSAEAPPLPGGLELIEAKVGDINGKPIYISTFFEPIEARLIAEAGRLSRNEWRRVATEEIIGPRLNGIIADELLRAEALASLTPQQRMGLRAFLSGFRRDLLSENLGSEQLARRRLESGTGQTLDQTLREKETDTLIRLTLFQEINRRINVSWRDIRQRYERDANIYSPPPVASFRVIRVPTDRAEIVEEITERLAGGAAFSEVASDPRNTFRPEAGGLIEAAYVKEFTQAEFFGSEELNERARTLTPGQTVGPFALGTSTTWLRLDGIERKTISLYEAQLRINQELTLERRRNEQQAYLDKLTERARVSNRQEMMVRLLRIAEDRYGPKGG